MGFFKKDEVLGKLVIDPEAKIIGTVTDVAIGTGEEKIALIVQCAMKALKKKLEPDYVKLHAMLLENVKKKSGTWVLWSPEWKLAKDVSSALNVPFQEALTNDNLVAYARAIGFEIPLLETEKEARVEIKIPWSNIAVVRDVVLTKIPIELPAMPTPSVEEKVCSSCGYQNPSYAKNFCIKCGAKLS